MTETIKAFVEGRGSMASLERAIETAENPLMTRAEMERELAAEWSLKNLFATIPPPAVGLSKVLSALRAAPDPEGSLESAEALKSLGDPLRKTLLGIQEPMGGFAAGLARLKANLAAARAPARSAEPDCDIKPGFDIMPAAGTTALRTVERRRSKRSTKIVQMPRRSSNWRDVLAAGKDLPENPDDIPDAE